MTRHGKTSVPADPRKLKNWKIFTEDLAAFVRKQGSPIVALGHSRGGTASLMLAVQYPDLVRALILIDPTILPFSWMWWWYLAKKTGAARLSPLLPCGRKTAGLAGPGNDFFNPIGARSP